MAQRVISSFDEFAVKMVQFNDTNRSRRRRAAEEWVRVAKPKFRGATRKLGGSDSTISGVGKNGAKLDTEFTVKHYGNASTVFIKPTGPWQIRDNSLHGRPKTAPRRATPNLKKSPRPMPPGKEWMPSLKTKGGQFLSNFNKGAGPYVVVVTRGRMRPAWKEAVRSLVPEAIEVSAEEFRNALDDVFR